MSSQAARPLALEPFHAVTYAQGDELARLTCPPYDVIGAQAVRRFEAIDPHNVVRLILPRPGDHETRYDHAARELRDWLATGVLQRAPHAALYVYEHDTPTGTALGLVGAVPLDAPILPHEDVFPAPVADRAALMATTGAQFEPILLTYEGDGEASDVVDAAVSNEPFVDVATDDDGRHRVWRVDEAEHLEAVAAGLAGRQALIADGHHRFAAYRRVRNGRPERRGGRHGLAMLVDAQRHPLELRGVHRCVSGLPFADAVARALQVFDVTALEGVDAALDALDAAEARRPATGPAFVVGDGKHWAMLHASLEATSRRMPADRHEAWRRQDSAIARHVLLEQLWDVPDADDRVSVHHDAEDAVDTAVERAGTVVLLRPPALADVLALARLGERMPQKSTSFGPKPRTGLLMRLTNA